MARNLNAGKYMTYISSQKSEISYSNVSTPLQVPSSGMKYTANIDQLYRQTMSGVMTTDSMQWNVGC